MKATRNMEERFEIVESAAAGVGNGYIGNQRA